MNRTVFFVVVVAVAAVLGGCATPPKSPSVDTLKVKQKHCKTDDCTVVVDASCPDDTWKNCTAFVDTDFVLVGQGNKPNLIWKMRYPANFVFDKQVPGGTGILFDPETTDIKDCKLDEAMQIVTCKNYHTNKPGEPVIYKYAIFLIKKGSPRNVDPLDPWILND